MASEPAIRTSQTPDQMLQSLDTNHDGKVSLEEFRAPQIALFNRIDTNHDGVVTPQEYQAAQGHK
jgi:Ca2+-binding EF-hand superfamily protein